MFCTSTISIGLVVKRSRFLPISPKDPGFDSRPGVHGRLAAPVVHGRPGDRSTRSPAEHGWLADQKIHMCRTAGWQPPVRARPAGSTPMRTAGWRPAHGRLLDLPPGTDSAGEAVGSGKWLWGRTSGGDVKGTSLITSGPSGACEWWGGARVQRSEIDQMGC